MTERLGQKLKKKGKTGSTEREGENDAQKGLAGISSRAVFQPEEIDLESSKRLDKRR